MIFTSKFFLLYLHLATTNFTKLSSFNPKPDTCLLCIINFHSLNGLSLVVRNTEIAISGWHPCLHPKGICIWELTSVLGSIVDSYGLISNTIGGIDLQVSTTQLQSFRLVNRYIRITLPVHPFQRAEGLLTMVKPVIAQSTFISCKLQAIRQASLQAHHNSAN